MPPSINVLVVDDIEQNLLATEALLARPGLNILKASSGEQALEILLVQEVALALIDVQMPQMDGFELAELIRGNSRTRSIPLIFLTAATGEPQRSFQGYQAGAVDFLYKPIDSAILRSKVEVFVELYAQRKQISHQLEELRQALQVNEMFMAVLGHDLRTPLSAVMNGAELILQLSADPKVNAAAERIRSSSLRMEKMVSQLLDVTRLRSGKLRLELQPASYEEVGRRIIEEFAHTDRIRMECQGDMQGMFDVDRIGQVLANLVGNALQHGDPEGPIRIAMDGSRGSHVLIRIRNRGSMAAEALARIFEPFQTGSQEEQSVGLGLGLYIVKRFVEAHGGSVSMTSTEEQGTTFEISLPRNA
ncbi:hybrid sensor histidine kinase/response regulator [Noviherbaspirillum massiliense]|uniref:hybrid sensor histidine kinase/response regulator n=1 Tax=Noviherbaspirillum massiliense TaxID=1465823 RepID=UPI000373E48F|nr:ATP-binding protein [Noviherbaspirillum massiliense]